MQQLTQYPFTIDLYQIGTKELRKPRIIQGHALAKDPSHLESIVTLHLKKHCGSSYVDFDLSWVEQSRP